MRSSPSTKQPEDGLTGDMNEPSFQNNGSDDHDDCDACRSDRSFTTFRIGLLNTVGQLAEHIDSSELANVFNLNPFCICHQVADDAKSNRTRPSAMAIPQHPPWRSSHQ